VEGDKKATDRYRKALFKIHCKKVLELVEPNEMMFQEEQSAMQWRAEDAPTKQQQKNK